MSLSKFEKETLISFNEDEGTADIQTYNGSLKRKLLSLCESRPNEAKQIRTDQHGGMYFTVPKKWIKVNATKILSPEQREKKAIIAKSLRNRL